MKSRKLKVEFPVFSGYTVYVELTDNIKQALQRRKVTSPAISQLGENTGGMVVHDDDGNSYMFLKLKPAVGTVAHESWHVIKALMEFTGVELDNEAVAYHLGYLVNRVWKFAQSR